MSLAFSAQAATPSLHFLGSSAKWPVALQLYGRYRGGKSAHTAQICGAEPLVQVSGHIRISTARGVDDAAGRKSRDVKKLTRRENHRPLTASRDHDVCGTITRKPRRSARDLCFAG